jgi:hypothetical protein
VSNEEWRQMGKSVKKTKTTPVAIASVGVGCGMGFALAGFLLRDWDFSWNWEVAAGPLATLGAGTAAIIAAAIALHNGEKTREQDKKIHEENSRAEQERALRERFTSIVELLATEDLTKRESGAYALAALADDWAAFYKDDQKSALREQQVCLNILTGLLREPIPSNRDEQKLLFKEKIQEIIFSRFKNLENNKEKNRESGIWSDLEPDLRKCHFYNLNITGVYFNQKISFANSTFAGDTSFNESTFRNCADFSGAKFLDIILFTRLNFTELTLFDRAVFNSGAIFWETKFDCETFFEDVDFLDSTFFYAGNDYDEYPKIRTEFLRKASFNGARFFGKAIFSNVIFHENTSFLDVQFRFKCTEEEGEEFSSGAIFNKTEFQTVSSFGGSMFAAPENHPDIMRLKSISSLENAKNVTFSASDFKERKKWHSLRNTSKSYQLVFRTPLDLPTRT